MKKITPCLWFDGNAEEAMNFYGSVFKNLEVVETLRSGSAGPGAKGSVLALTFRLNGQEFSALNGGPQYSFTPAISMMVPCDTQAEVDELWDKLGAGGKYIQCGWLTDKYGLSWQIVPRLLYKLLQDKDAEKAGRVMQAMMKMIKLDSVGLQRAYEGQ